MELKDQLEDIQKRMEDEIQAGVPAVSPPYRLHRARVHTLFRYMKYRDDIF